MAAIVAQALVQVAAAEPVADKNGVIMYDYGGSIGTVYNPKVVAIEGMKYRRDYQITGDLEARQHYINSADWLVDHATDRQLCAVGIRLQVAALQRL
ncbi:MAG TPA: hypothetical protein VD736_01880 [Nitrososphaera sp.]|nr:hypothetical protein [Nitrososphaera sp.]